MALGTTSLQSHPCLCTRRPRPGWRERRILSSLGFLSASPCGASLGLREPGLSEVLAPDGVSPSSFLPSHPRLLLSLLLTAPGQIPQVCLPFSTRIKAHGRCLGKTPTGFDLAHSFSLLKAAVQMQRLLPLTWSGFQTTPKCFEPTRCLCVCLTPAQLPEITL